MSCWPRKKLDEELFGGCQFIRLFEKMLDKYYFRLHDENEVSKRSVNPRRRLDIATLLSVGREIVWQGTMRFVARGDA
jgi:hypothetical protein